MEEPLLLDPIISLLPEGFEIVLADVGSAGGLKDRWRPARDIISGLMFEPRERGTRYQKGRDIFLPIGIGAQKKRCVLNVTALPNMSSTLEPNLNLLQTFRKKGRHGTVVSKLEIELDTLDTVCANEGCNIDVLKADTQGSELSILHGAQNCLTRSVIAAEIELSFLERYQGQALASDIISYMSGLGFDLLDIHRIKRYRHKNEEGVGNISLGRGQRAGRISYGDGFFFLKERRLLERIEALPRNQGEAQALRAIIILLVYGKPDLAARVFDLTQGTFEVWRKEAIFRYLRRVGRRYLRSGLLHHVIDYLARHA